jgi:hypothetical protein
LKIKELGTTTIRFVMAETRLKKIERESKLQADAEAKAVSDAAKSAEFLANITEKAQGYEQDYEEVSVLKLLRFQ